MKGIFLLATFCITLAGVAQRTETRALKPFTGLGASEGIAVYLQKGDQESARIETSDIMPEEVITEVSGSYLKIHMSSGRHNNRGPIRVYVTYKALDNIYASSAARITSEETVEGNTLKIGCSSAGQVRLNIAYGSVSVNVSSAAEVELSGKVSNLEAEVSSAGEMEAFDLSVQKATISASSAGSARVSVVEGIEATASSGGNVRYRGNPKRSITHSSSGGSVHKTD